MWWPCHWASSHRNDVTSCLTDFTGLRNTVTRIDMSSCTVAAFKINDVLNSLTLKYFFLKRRINVALAWIVFADSHPGCWCMFAASSWSKINDTVKSSSLWDCNEKLGHWICFMQSTKMCKLKKFVIIIKLTILNTRPSAPINLTLPSNLIFHKVIHLHCTPGFHAIAFHCTFL